MGNYRFQARNLKKECTDEWGRIFIFDFGLRREHLGACPGGSDPSGRSLGPFNVPVLRFNVLKRRNSSKRSSSFNRSRRFSAYGGGGSRRACLRSRLLVKPSDKA